MSVPTSASIHKRIMNNVQFQKGNTTTSFLEDYLL